MLIQIRKIIKLLRLATASPRALDPHNHYVALEQLFTVTTSAFSSSSFFLFFSTQVAMFVQKVPRSWGSC